MLKKQLTSRRIQVALGVVLLAGLAIQWQRAGDLRGAAAGGRKPTRTLHPGPNVAFAAPVEPIRGESLEATAARDPMGFIQMALDRYDGTVRDYTCTFSKQERIAGKLSTQQVMNAYFREEPFSVRLEWTRNADKCSRVLYVADQWVEKGQQMAMVEPAGSIARLLVSYVMRPISGEEALKSSRRTIDQFGLRNSLLLTLKYAKLARDKKLLDFTFRGPGEVDKRPTLVFERRLPYTSEDGPWPDRVLVVHLDRELLLPLLCEAYADDHKKVLLGRYHISNLKLNANLADSTFTKEGMGF